MSPPQHYSSPGVYPETKFTEPDWHEFRTGVPVFIGYTTDSYPAKGHRAAPVLSAFEQLAAYYGAPRPGSYLAYAVRGFFENGGEQCYIAPLPSTGPGGESLTPAQSLDAALHTTERMNTIDLVCAPDIFADFVRPADAAADDQFFDDYTQQQQAIVQHCGRVGGRFAILDADRGAAATSALQRARKNWSEIDGPDGALYVPWVKVRAGSARSLTVPPCGHIAGVYARSDRERGVHKAPANELLAGVTDLEFPITTEMQGPLNRDGINCLRAFPGRGIRVWGARTLTGHETWRYVNARRVFTMAIRWIQWRGWILAFEPNDPSLWGRIERELSTYFTGQYRRGALKGNSPQEAFYVKCDETMNPPESRDAGFVISEIGLAVTPEPFEFVVVRLIHSAGGVRIAGPVGSWQPSEGE